MAQLLDFRNIPRTMQASDAANLDAYRASITKNVCDSVILHYRLRLTAINQLNLCHKSDLPSPPSVFVAQNHSCSSTSTLRHACTALVVIFCEDRVRSAQRLRRRIVDCAADCADGFAGANVRIRTQRMK